MEVDNNKPDDDKSREPINSSQLFYVDNIRKGKLVSRVADNSPVNRSQCVYNETLALMTSPQTQGQVNNNNRSNSEQQLTFNINLLYDVNQAIDQDSWDGVFQPISLHGLMEHLLSDINNIKVSLK